MRAKVKIALMTRDEGDEDAGKSLTSSQVTMTRDAVADDRPAGAEVKR